MSRRASAQPPRQNPARSPVIAIGRPAGDSSASSRADATAGQRRRAVQAEERLRPRRGQRRVLRVVHAGPPARQRQMLRQFSIQSVRQLPRQQARKQHGSQVEAGQLAQPAHADQVRHRARRRPWRPARRRTDRGHQVRRDRVHHHRFRHDRVRRDPPRAIGFERRSSATRACNWRAASVQGNGRSAAAATACARAAAVSAGSAGSVRSDSTSVPSRRRRRENTAPDTGSKPVSDGLGDPRGKGGGQRLGIERRGQADAAPRPASPAPRPPAAWRWPAGRCAAGWRRRRRTGGSCPARRAAGRCGPGKPAASRRPGSPAGRVSTGRRRRRRYCAAAWRMRVRRRDRPTDRRQ